VNIEANLMVTFLAFARIFAMLELTPLISAAGMPFAARAGLAFFVANVVAPTLMATYVLPPSNFEFALLLLTEVLIGLIIGFFVLIIFSIMTSAGQMFSLQMGFAATEAFDPTSDIDNTVMGQFLNLAGLFIFLSTFGLQQLFFIGVSGSFFHFNAVTLVFAGEGLAMFMLNGLVVLFGQAIIIAMPLIGSLFLVSVTMGLLSKAAPQMNLMMVGFPIQIGVGFIILFLALPNILTAFMAIVDNMFASFTGLFRMLGGG